MSLIVRAEMNGLDFDHRVLRPWARNPDFYVTVFADETDQPAREGPHALGGIELFRFSLPGDSDELARRLAHIPGLLQQARGNLTGDARDLWIYGIRDVKAQIKTLHFRFNDDEKLKPALAAADDLDKKMSDVEKELIQVNMKGSEGNLAFPSMLNERFDGFSHFIDTGDSMEPTKSELDVFQTLSKQLDEQLAKWTQIKSTDVVKVSDMIKGASLPGLIIPPKNPKSS